MNKKQRFYLFFLFLSIIFLIYILWSLYAEGKLFYLKSYGMRLFFLELIIPIIVLLTILFFMEKFHVYKKIGLFSINLHIVEAAFIALLIIFVAALGEIIVYDYTKQSETQQNHFSIGIYLSKSYEPLNFSGENINNPVLTRTDIFDTDAAFIADPFLIHENNTFYLFFEVFNTITSTGDIGVAESTDGFNWTYTGIVLDEPFHLAYPCVFTYNEKYYMIPDTGHIKSIRLYQAVDFPYRWSFEKTLIDGTYFVDSTIFYYNNTWWLFTQSFTDSSLHLFFSDSPLDVWVEHPKSPIIVQDDNISRPGGNVIVDNNRIFRYTQDNYPSYGLQVWAFEITRLTRDEYLEEKVGKTPLLKGYDSWNKLGMHHISICKFDDHWIAAVDGKGRP